MMYRSVRRLRAFTRAGLCAVTALASVAALTSLGPIAVSTSAAEVCVNEAVREEQGAAALALPDCRAYEMVSPPGSVPSSRAIASVGGQRFAYYTLEPFPGSDEEGLFLLATRGSSGWSVQNTTPPQGGLHDSDQVACYPSVFYSEELTSAVLADGWNYFEQGHDQVCEGDDPPLVAGEPRGYGNIFLRDNEDGSYGLIDAAPEEGSPANALFRDASTDLSHVVFSEEAKLTPEAPPGLDLYEWANGVDRLVTLLPGGEPVVGTLANAGTINNDSATFTHAVSASGETVFFDAGGNLYARLHAGQEPAAGGVCGAGEPERACTVQIDAGEAGAPGPGGGGVFVDASEDGSRVFFTDENSLTAGASATPDAPDLYEYDLQTGKLSDLTVSSVGSANVLGFSGASADGSYVYFVATGVLTGDRVNSLGASAVQYKPNLYLRHNGTTTFIATLERQQDRGDWQESSYGEKNDGYLAARVSPNGEYVAFNSVEELTGYDNEPAESKDCNEDRCSEIFLYDAAANQLSCASCVVSGEPPNGPAEIPFPVEELMTSGPPKYLPRNVLDDGRVFFDTRSALVPQATNGEVNVYEYENGAVSLISSGVGSGASEFLDASASGSDVFFSTGQGLVQSDTDNMVSVYDARVDGGFPSEPSGAEGAPACESAEACKPPPIQAPAQFSAASAGLSAGESLAAPPAPITPSRPAGEAAVRRSTRAQKLARALKVCAKQPKRRRAACRVSARRRFGVPAKKKSGTGGGRRAVFSERRSGRAG